MFSFNIQKVFLNKKHSTSMVFFFVFVGNVWIRLEKSCTFRKFIFCKFITTTCQHPILISWAKQTNVKNVKNLFFAFHLSIKLNSRVQEGFGGGEHTKKFFCAYVEFPLCFTCFTKTTTKNTDRVLIANELLWEAWPKSERMRSNFVWFYMKWL